MSVFWVIFLYVWCREGGALSEIWVLMLPIFYIGDCILVTGIKKHN